MLDIQLQVKQVNVPDIPDNLVEDLLDEANAIILNRIRTRYLNEVDIENVSWKPSIAGIKRRAAGGTGTLFDTGRLFRSIQLARSNDRERVIGTDVPYASHHQFGTRRLPIRSFLGFNNDDVSVVELRFQSMISKYVDLIKT